MSLAHYVFARGPSVRDFIDPRYTVASYARKRWLESSSASSIAYNWALPLLQEMNAHLEEHIQTMKNTGTDDEDLVADFKESLHIALVKFGDFAARTSFQTLLVICLIRHESPLALSVVQSYDSYQRLHHEYFKRFFGMLHLPTMLAGLVGPPPEPREVRQFETRPLSIVAAAEDAVKRQVIFFITDVTVGSLLEVLRARQLIPTGSNATLKGSTERSSARALANHLSSTVIRYCFVIGGAVAGSRFSRGSAEYCGEMLGAIAAVVVNGIRLQQGRSASASRR